MAAAAGSADLIQIRVKLTDKNKVLKSISKTGTTVRQVLNLAGVDQDVEMDRIKMLKGFPPKVLKVASEQGRHSPTELEGISF
jgi:hypothetical protein